MPETGERKALHVVLVEPHWHGHQGTYLRGFSRVLLEQGHRVTALCPFPDDAAAAFARVQKALEKTVTDFQGHDLTLEGSDTSTAFKFKSMAFTIQGKAEATADAVGPAHAHGGRTQKRNSLSENRACG